MKTAVEQLMIDSFGEDFRMTVNDYQLNVFQKALEKEKKQIINAHFDGIPKFFSEDSRINDAEEYFNDKYNQNK